MPYKDPKQQRDYQKGWESRRWGETREYIEAAKAGGCVHCPESDPAALDFHHVDPGKKSFELGQRRAWRTIEEIDAEIAKCVVLCRNCHAKLHAGRFIL